MHRNASRVGWLNDAIGVLGMLPYMAPFYLEKWFHLQHHALLNRRDDPNYIYTDGPYWQLPLRYVRVLRYARRAHARRPAQPRRALDRPPAARARGRAASFARACWRGALRRPV